MDELKDSWAPPSKISEKIRSRIKKDNARYHANDNISKYIEPGELEQLQEEVKEKLQDERPQGENLEYFTEWINTIW